MFVTD